MQTQSVVGNSTITIDTWIDALQAQYNRYRRAGWDFLFLLRDGIDALPRNDHERAKLYQDIGNQLNLAVHTLQNYVSAARKPYATLAQELDLEIGHLDAVLGLADDVAEDVLKLAAEQAWSVAQTRKEAYPRRNNPDIGKQTVSDVERFLSANEEQTDDVPYGRDSIHYQDYAADADNFFTDEDNSITGHDGPDHSQGWWTMPMPELAAILRRYRDEGEIATLIDALLR